MRRGTYRGGGLMTEALLERLSELQRYARLLAHHPLAEARQQILLEEWAPAREVVLMHPLWWARAQALEKLVLLSIAYLEGMECIEGLSIEQLDLLVESLEPTELFWTDEGGLFGYQSRLLSMLVAPQRTAQMQIHAPPTIPVHPSTAWDSSGEHDAFYWQRVWKGLHALKRMAEIYPVGGAGDRLDLRDPITQEPLPVALLQFAGMTLLEGLIEDLFAREWLYYRLTGEQVRCPVAMMTSWEKDNHRHLHALCEARHWFGRGRSHFRLFAQPLVPAINEVGHWIFLEPGKLLLKPGGHGAIWRLMEERGILQWLTEQGCTYGITRQINNPLAGSDANLLTLVGHGEERQAAVGFLGCPRKVGAAEGMVVLVEESLAHRWSYCIQNIEYTEFTQLGWKDQPAQGRDVSPFPSNTNILYVSLQAVQQALSRVEHRGEVLNLKAAAVPFATGAQEMVIGRLESTMQSIAEAFPCLEPSQVNDPQDLPFSNFILEQERALTISTAKRSHHPGQSSFETPVGCYLEWLKLRLRWLQEAGWVVPEIQEGESTPPCMVRWLPALAPLATMIPSVFGRGSLAAGSELRLDLAEARLDQVSVEGSLVVTALHPYGPESNGETQFSPSCGQVVLQRVKVRNLGCERPQSWDYRGHPQHVETCSIVLKGGARFVARDVELIGAMEWVVEDGECLELTQDVQGKIHEHRRSWTPEWLWKMTTHDQGLFLHPCETPAESSS